MLQNLEQNQHSSLWTQWLSRIFPRVSRPILVGRLDYRPCGAGPRFIRERQTKRHPSSMALRLRIGEACE